MTSFPRLCRIVIGIFGVHPSALTERVTLAALSSSHRGVDKRQMLSEAIERAFGVFIPDRDLTDCLTLGALAEAIDDEAIDDGATDDGATDDDMARATARRLQSLQAAE